MRTMYRLSSEQNNVFPLEIAVNLAQITRHFMSNLHLGAARHEIQQTIMFRVDSVPLLMLLLLQLLRLNLLYPNDHCQMRINVCQFVFYVDSFHLVVSCFFNMNFVSFFFFLSSRSWKGALAQCRGMEMGKMLFALHRYIVSANMISFAF